MSDQLALFAGGGSIPRARLPVELARATDRLQIPEGVRTNDCTHTVHRFPGKFIPTIPRFLFRTVLGERKGKVVLDPFCGSGTTLVEAALEGRRFVGLDIDPLAVLISAAKTAPLSIDEMHDLESSWGGHQFDDWDPSLVPDVPRLEHWFSQTAIRQLSSIKKRSKGLSGDARTFALVVFSSVIRQVSNADDQTQKTYVSHTLLKKAPLPADAFPPTQRRALNGMQQYLDLLPQAPQGYVRVADARDLPNDIEFDDVLTSPPYIDSIDYVYNQMLEYFWLLRELGVNTHNEYKRFRKRPMGFSVPASADWQEFERMCRDAAKRLAVACRKIDLVSKKEADNVRGFFVDLMKHVRGVRSRQRRGAYYICIIGNSVIRGIDVPTAESVAALFTTMGYSLVDRVSYEIRRHYMKFPRRGNSGKIKEDHILVFKAR